MEKAISWCSTDANKRGKKRLDNLTIDRRACIDETKNVEFVCMNHLIGDELFQLSTCITHIDRYFASDSHFLVYCAVVHSLCDRSVMWSSICLKWTDILQYKHFRIDCGGFMAPVSMLNDLKTFGDLPAWYQLQSSWILVRFSLCGCDKLNWFWQWFSRSELERLRKQCITHHFE